MLRARATAQLHEVWGWVRRGLLDCIDRAPAHYLPEDVYAALRAGSAWLFAVERHGEDVGFVVLERHADPDGVVLFVFAAIGAGLYAMGRR